MGRTNEVQLRIDVLTASKKRLEGLGRPKDDPQLKRINEALAKLQQYDLPEAAIADTNNPDNVDWSTIGFERQNGKSQFQNGVTTDQTLRAAATDPSAIVHQLEKINTRKGAREAGFNHVGEVKRQARRVLSHIKSHDFQEIRHVWTDKDEYKKAFNDMKAKLKASGASHKEIKEAKETFEAQNKLVDGRALEGLKKLADTAKKQIDDVMKQAPALKDKVERSNKAKKAYEAELKAEEAKAQKDQTKIDNLKAKIADLDAQMGQDETEIAKLAGIYGQFAYAANIFPDGEHLAK